MAVIPFYGTTQPELFAIERAAMDRSGHVVAALDAALPDGLVLDIGAGDGHTGARLRSDRRSIVALEPASAMIGRNPPSLRWVRGDAERLPFAPASLDAAYATWAYFFSRDWDPAPGLSELHRVVRPGGPLLIVDNLGGDDFCSLAETDISADPAFWADRGFDCRVIETSFEFESMQNATDLLSFYFGEAGRRKAAIRVPFRVGLFVGISAGAV